MQTKRIATTSTSGLKPLGTAYQRSFELVTDTIRDRLSPEHAALFAEPVQSEFGDSIDWYVEAASQPQPLDALSPEARPVAETVFQRLRGEIAELGAQLTASADSDDRRLGEAIANAIEHPAQGAIYVLPGAEGAEPQPVLINWAWTDDQATKVRGTLVGADTRQSAQPRREAAQVAAMGAGAAATPPTAARGSGALWAWLYWLGWVLLAALLTAISYLMLPACGLNLPGVPNTCPPPGEERLAVVAGSAVLRDEIAQLEHRLAVADRACQPPPPQAAIAPEPVPPAPVLPPEPTPELAEESEIDRRIDRDGAQLGDLTFSLAWNSRSDLDMHVTCPSGQTVAYFNRSACNGRLDIDANAGGATDEPLENIFFNGPNGGTYSVRVHLYSSRGSGTEPFELQIRDGDRVERIQGTVSRGSTEWRTDYTYGGQ